MAAEFRIPVKFEELELPAGEGEAGAYRVASVPAVRDLGETAGANLLFDAEEALGARGADLAARADELFDRLYAFVGAFGELGERQRGALVGALTKGLAQLLGAVGSGAVRDSGAEERAEHRNALKMYCFLLAAAVSAGERAARDAAIVKRKRAKKGADGGWHAHKEALCGALVHAAESREADGLWNAASPEEAYGNLFFKTAALLLEGPDNTRDQALRGAVFKLFASPVRRFGFQSRATAAVVHLLHNFEHLPAHVAELLRVCAEEYGSAQFVADVIRDIGRTDTRLLGQDTSGARNLAAFMAELADRLPRVVLRHVSLLVGHLDSDSYAMRNGVVLVLGKLVTHLSEVQRKAEAAAAAGGAPDPDAEEEAADARKRIGQLYELLEERALDVTSYTRSKTLQTWAGLVEGGCVAKSVLPSVVGIAVGRLEDKSSQVRKYAIQLLTALLRYNPFAGSLAADDFKAKLQELGTDFKECMEDLQRRTAEMAEAEKAEAEKAAAKAKKANKAKGGKARRRRRRRGDESSEEEEESEEEEDEDVSEMSVDEDEDDEAKEREAGEGEGEGAVSAAATHAMSPEEDAALKAKKQQLDWCFGALRFITAVEEAAPTLCRLFSSKSSTDVLECVDFFVTATKFRLGAASTGVRKMLVLVWSKEESVRKAVLDAYVELYVGRNPRAADALRVARRLVALTDGATLADMTSLEELLAQMTHRRAVPAPVVRALWDLVSRKVEDATPDERSGAMAVLGMMGGARPDLITARIGTVVEVGFGPEAAAHPLLCRHACVALQRSVLGRTVPKGGSTAGLAASLIDGKRLDSVHKALGGVLERPTRTKRSLDAWFPAAEQAVSALFLLHPDPELVCGDTLQRLSRGVFGGDSKGAPAAAAAAAAAKDEEAAGENAPPANGDGGAEDGGKPAAAPAAGAGADDTPAAWRLAKLFFLLGHVGLKLLVSLEQSEGHLKFARREANKAADGGGGKEGKKKGGGKKKGKSGGGSQIEDELAVGASQDYEIEVVREDAEKALLFGRNLLAAYAPLVVRVCQSPKAFPDPTLRAAASLALCKLMCLNSSFCESNLPLLFTLLERDECASTRANVVIALGDMAFRFPNEIEPWSGKLYLRLRDRDAGVRRNTMMVLTHLILNDMIKVKGPISEMAKSLLDEDARIADMARVFFQELAQKGKNPIYNILPDAISRLSADAAVSPDAFRTIMAFLIAFVEKERQLEMLVDKLSQRFGDRTDVQSVRDLAFCLSQLSFVDKSVKRLRDNFRHYKDALFDDEVWAGFDAFLAKGKKFAKPETKKQIEELEQMLGECHTSKSEDHKVSSTAAKRARRGKKGAKKGAKKAAGDGSGGDDDDDDYVARELQKAVASAAEVAETQRRTGVRLTRKDGRRVGARRGAAAAADGEEEAAAAPAPAKKKPAPRRRARRVVVEESSEEEDDVESSSSSDDDVDEMEVSDDDEE